MLTLLCLFFGHKLGVLRVNPRKVAAMMHLSERAGLDTVCFRCGQRMNDAGPIERRPDPSHPYRSLPC